MPRCSMRSLLVALLAACGGPPRHAGPPTYADYPVARYDGPAAPLQLPDSATEVWRAALAPMVAAGPTFAGGLVVGASSCGDGCIITAIVDLRTGKVHHDHAFVPVCFDYSFVPTSALMIARPVAMPPGSARGDCPDVTRYYRWTGDSLALLLELPETS
jgi:hypothetical protein